MNPCIVLHFHWRFNRRQFVERFVISLVDYTARRGREVCLVRVLRLAVRRICLMMLWRSASADFAVFCRLSCPLRAAAAVILHLVVASCVARVVVVVGIDVVFIVLLSSCKQEKHCDQNCDDSRRHTKANANFCAGAQSRRGRGFLV